MLQTVDSLVPGIETYSIDESFLDLTGFPERKVEPLARALRQRVLQRTGLPTYVGIGPTKTLAKVASYLAKKRPQFGCVFDLRTLDVRNELLATVAMGEILGCRRGV